MDTSSRRIRRLALRGGRDAQLGRVRLRLEDAFRTASLPGLPPQALVVVRRLDLGCIDAGTSPARLAARIDDAVRQLASGAVCAEHGEVGSAAVVWFHDALQARIQLLTRLLDGRPAWAWYWRSLFSAECLRPGRAAIAALLLDSLDTPAGALAPARLLDAVMTPGRMAPLLDALDVALARRLLHAQGQRPARPAAAPHASAEGLEGKTTSANPMLGAPFVTERWKSILRQAAQRWGTEDLRSDWLALQALFHAQPAYLTRSDNLQRLSLSHWLSRWQGNDHWPALHPAARPMDGARAVEAPAATRAAGEAAAKPGQGEERLANGVPPSCVTTTPGPPSLVGAARRPAEPAPSPVHRSPLEGPRFHPPLPQRPVWPAGQTSAHAGLALLIPLWQRLGLETLLRADEALLQADLPLRLLQSMARRLGVTASDPIVPLLAALPSRPDDAPLAAFTAPGPWWRLLREDRPLVCRSLADGSGRVVLAAPRGRWHLYLGEAGEAERLARRHGLSLVRRKEIAGAPGWQALCRDLQYLGALYLRRYAGLSLRVLVCRRGRVALTRSHWDTLFPLHGIDLRLRRIALDSDPGWVPWLGRVMQFHYRDEE